MMGGNEPSGLKEEVKRGKNVGFNLANRILGCVCSFVTYIGARAAPVEH